MSSRREGYLHTDRKGDAPPKGGVATRLLFALLLSLIASLQFSTAFADQYDEAPSRVKDLGLGGTGLFAIPLEDLLEIDVSTKDHFSPSRDGVYSLTSHELLRLYAAGDGSIETNDAAHHADNKLATKQIPVLIRGEYAGSFNDLRAAIRFVQHITRNDRRVDLYVGSLAQWFERGRHQIILDVREGADSLTNEPSLDTVFAATTADTLSRIPIDTEVQP